MEPLELSEGEELLAKIIAVEERRKILRRHRGALDPAPRSFSTGSRWRLRNLDREQELKALDPWKVESLKARI